MTPHMQRITISIDEGLAADFDRYVQAREYQNRSEGVRDLVRDAVERWRLESSPDLHCVAVVSFVYSPMIRGLALRLSALQLAHHDMVAAWTQTPLDHGDALVSVIAKGRTDAVRALADAIRAERGVRFGSINLIGVEPGDAHSHAGDHAHSGHLHLSPRPG